MTSIATTFAPTMGFGRLRKRLRAHAEPLGGLAVLVLCLWQAPWIAAKFAAGGWSVSNFYTGVTGWASIQTGFLFAIYTFVVASSEPFIKAVSATSAFRAYKRYMLSTLYLTFAVAVVALVLSVAGPVPAPSGFGAVAFAVWCSVVVFSALCFLKVVRSFRKLDRAR